MNGQFYIQWKVRPLHKLGWKGLKHFVIPINKNVENSFPNSGIKISGNILQNAQSVFPFRHLAASYTEIEQE